jgi:hypothetical protein
LRINSRLASGSDALDSGGFADWSADRTRQGIAAAMGHESILSCLDGIFTSNNLFAFGKNRLKE